MTSRFHYALALILLFVSGAVYAAYNPSDIKAVYIFRIANFIYWDDENEMLDIEICVVGNRDIASTLSKVTHNKTIRRLPIIVSPQFRPECDILFIDSSEVLSVPKAPKNTLVIGDNDDIRDLGGSVQLVTIDGKIKPKIFLNNVGAFSVSSGLLQTAIVEMGSRK